MLIYIIDYYLEYFKIHSEGEKMAELLINEGTLFHNILLDETQQNISRIKDLQSMSKKMNGLFGDFSDSLNKFCRQMFKNARNDQQEDQSIVFLTKFIIDLLMEFTKKVNQVNKKISTEIMDPLDQFLVSQHQSYKQLLDKSGQQLASIQANSSFLNELTKNFNINAKNPDLNQNQKIELKQIYEIEMQKCNEKWLEIKDAYKEILADGDSINSFRCNFMIKCQIKLCKQINRLVNSSNIDESLVSYEELFEENQSLSISIKQKIRDRFGKSILLEQRAMQEFNEENHFSLNEKIIVDDFINMFTSYSNVKEDEKKYEKARSLILQNFYWSHYFLTRLRTNLHTQIKLPVVKYHEMTTIIKYLFAVCAQNQQNQQIIYSLLYISYRMTYNGTYIIRELGKHDKYWYNEQKWFQLIEYVKGLREQNHNKQSIGYRVKSNGGLKGYVRSGLLWISQNPNIGGKIGTQKRIRSEKTISDGKVYDIVCEINYFMSRLELQEKFIFEFIVRAGNFYGFSLEGIKKLLKFHYFNKKNAIDKVGNAFIKRKKRLEEKYKHISRQQKICICVGKSLKYLEVSPQLLNLRLVSKLWAEQLKKKINIRFLIQERNVLYLTRNRLDLYLGLCPSIINQTVFDKMLNELPDFTEHADIIALDAKRSLSWDETLREKLVLILKCFAFYHPNVGYLQGMNYLCENILKLTDDVFTGYKIFEYLMNNQFYGMYSANFDGLKMKIYQFMRIVQREKPKLYDHFLSQKLQGEHFLLPWAITLWGQMSGDIVWFLWDGFLCKGWKWWIKTGLWLLNILEPELLEMNFEQMMKTFSELGTGLLSMNMEQLKDFGIDFKRVKKQIDAIEVHCETLSAIEQQYKLKVGMVNQYMKKIKTNKKRN